MVCLVPLHSVHPTLQTWDANSCKLSRTQRYQNAKSIVSILPLYELTDIMFFINSLKSPLTSAHTYLSLMHPQDQP